ncbi:MAG: SpoIID/LytB domain-containing protein [Synechococcus sp.]
MLRLISLAALLFVTAGCRARELAQPSPGDPADGSAPSAEQRAAVPPTHRPIPPPPPATSSNATLWVALADHLGVAPQASPLDVVSAGAPLQLRDASGRRWSASSAQVRWSVVPLPPYELARRVAGPFASFESADRVAQRWRAMGVEALVAHPGEWEVWAPADALVPEGLTVRSWSTVVTQAVRPVLELADGGHSIEGTLVIEAPDGLRWGRGVYRGPFRLQPDAYGSWTLVEQVPLERYLEGVVPHEIGASAPEAALQAQTVLARTWALANSHRFVIDGYHLCSDTQCQVYSDPRIAGVSVRQAIAATAGQVLSWQGAPISAVYHASNGGVMASGPEAWSMAAVPYLAARPDGDAAWMQRHPLPLNDAAAVQRLLQDRQGAHGATHPRFRWTRSYGSAEILQALGDEGQQLQVPLQLRVVERGVSGRVLALEIAGAGDAAPVVLSLDRIRRTLRRLPSTLFVLQAAEAGRWGFQGGGFGHGAGLSQAGAIQLAYWGWGTQRILSHYYPGAIYGPLNAPVHDP